MSTETINRFAICDKINYELKVIIKLLFVFRNDLSNNANVLFVTIDDKVFCLGDNKQGVCGLGHDSAINEPQLVPELCEKGVQQLHNGWTFALAHTMDNSVYVWGMNNHGELCTGSVERANRRKIYKPLLIDFFRDKPIRQISCGRNQTLVLTEDGLVYGWGDNSMGQIGCGRDIGDNIPIVIQLEVLSDVKSIYCRYVFAFALTNDGLVYSWGDNYYGVLGQEPEQKRYYLPKLVENLPKIDRICCWVKNSYFQTTDSRIYYCGEFYEQKPTDHGDCQIAWSPMLLHSEDPLDIGWSGDDCAKIVAKSEDMVYELDYNLLTETHYKTVFDYYCDKYRITYQTMSLDTTTGDSQPPTIQVSQVIYEDYIDYADNLVEILKTFTISKHLGDVMPRIKAFHIFDDRKGYNMLFVTTDDNVYGFGSNRFASCGLGHNSPVNEPQLIPELCKKNITKFYTGKSFVLAQTAYNTMFVWGMYYIHKDKDQSDESSDSSPRPEILIKTKHYLKPKKIDNLKNVQTIVDVSCGHHHALILSSTGRVYQFQNDLVIRWYFTLVKDVTDYIAYARLVDRRTELSDISSIHCSQRCSFAVNHNGFVYYWRYYFEAKFGKDSPKIIQNLKNISKVLSRANVNNVYEAIYFVTKNKKLFKCKYLGSEVDYKRVECDLPVDSINRITTYNKNSDVIVVLSGDTVYQLADKDLFVRTRYKNFYEFFAEEYQLTYKTIDLRLQNKIKANSLDVSEFSTVDSELDILGEIGSGSFGTVFKVKSKVNNEVYALKLIKYRGNNDHEIECISREISILSELRSERIVKYLKTWIDNNNSLYIQMEFCSDNLKNIIYYKSKLFAGSDQDETNSNNFVYFITCKIFIELIEAVKFLHDRSPPIMHRDLKPANVLFDEQGRNGVFFKLCDFGLARLHDSSSKDSMNNPSSIEQQAPSTSKANTSYLGTYRYMAPEVLDGHYDTRCDIYSLGVIGRELFENCLTSSRLDSPSTASKSKMNEILQNMCSSSPEMRPSCQDIGRNSHQWANITVDELANSVDYGKLASVNVPFVNYIKYHLDQLDLSRVVTNAITVDEIDNDLELDDFNSSEDESANMVINDSDYEIIESIGAGTFSHVYKCVGSKSKSVFALKIIDKNAAFVQDNIEYWDQCFGREIDLLSQLRSKRVVHYMKTWIDNNNNLYIQMEFCSDNLRNILDTKHLVFNRNKQDCIDLFEHSISSRIFVEIVEAVKYLHDQKPPIMHRDIKPGNVLFDEHGGQHSGVFFKLCDFGLAKLHEALSHTRGVGTQRYTAPEVRDGHYDTKTDVYSLGVVAKEIFELDNFDRRNDCAGSELKNRILATKQLIDKLCTIQYDSRPSCSHVLDQLVQMPCTISDGKIFNLNVEHKPKTSLYQYINYHVNHLKTKSGLSNSMIK